MNLKTQRLNIRFISEEDWKSLSDIWDDFGCSQYAKYDIPHAETAAEVREKAKQWAKVSLGKEHMFFSICLGEKMIGYIDFHENTEGYECGYCFHSDYHGKGYAKESLGALFNWLSDQRKTRFTAGTALKNLPSVRFLLSLGMEKRLILEKHLLTMQNIGIFILRSSMKK